MLDHYAGVHGHGIGSMKIKSIEICNRSDIEERETFWIKELNTIFPYGLNNDGKVVFLKNAFSVVTSNKSNICIYNQFNTKRSSRTGKGRKDVVNT